MKTQKPISAIPTSFKGHTLSKSLSASIGETTENLHVVNEPPLKTAWVAIHGRLLSTYINGIYLLHLFYR